jgi:uncharacterized protein YaaQ
MKKMIVAILKDEDTEAVVMAMVERGYSVTRIASTGGFLRQGRTTLMIGVGAEQVDQAIQLIRENCAPTIELLLKRATVFVLNVDHFEQL